MLDFRNLVIWAYINNVVCCIREIFSANATFSYKPINKVLCGCVLRINRIFDRGNTPILRIETVTPKWSSQDLTEECIGFTHQQDQSVEHACVRLGQ